GACVSTPADSQSKKIDIALKADGKLRRLEVKLLLLGAGEAGKTTILKQMKLMHASGFSCPEREAFRIFFDAVDRLYDPKYIPEDADIIRCRVKSTGITETLFHLGTLTYRMFDVGGQRSERKKWIHCFEGVTAVLFLVAISGYDQCLVEDKDSNQMEEALMLFDQICNSQWFIDTAMIMFMNKTDIFREKIKTSSIKAYFPDYT
ncbi:hypothetical protein BGX20_005609, partial [Mortierella sp. AD010]